MTNTARQTVVLWISLAGFTAFCVYFRNQLGAFSSYPDTLVLPLTDPMNVGMRWFVDNFGFIFKAVSWLFEWPIRFAQVLLQAIPWAGMLFFVTWLSWRAGGVRLAIFCAMSVMYMVVIGYWPEAMNSLALVLISVPMAVAVGFAVGTWGFTSERAYRAIMPTLDLLQTIPAFAYLLPILLLFGFGTTVGLVASVIFAFPPMVRNTIVGLRGVSPEVIESGQMSGATSRQLFWQVRVPSARKQLLLGVNQATMAALSMVIIAAIIGGTDDIGWEVLSTMRKAQFGESLLAGLVIALIAIMLDRITSGFALRSTRVGIDADIHLREWGVVVIGVVAITLISNILPILAEWPKDWRWMPAPTMNAALEWVSVEYRTNLEAVKTFAFFYVMLPLKIGFSKAISPFSWGFAFTPMVLATYAMIVVVAAGVLAWSGRLIGGIAVMIAGLVLHSGLTGTPWVVLVALFTGLAWQVGGKPLAFGTFAGLVFLLVTGIWEPSVLSIYLCGVGVLVSFGLGSVIGVWASESARVSAVVRPVIDTLQTMPLFVILIPFVMVFKIGEFTALLAIIAYSIVPAIRYAEHGLRNLPKDTLEAATAIGATRRQLLFQVKLPLAIPSIMLGLNQTIMFGISMLVITALVGTDDLGQQIYIGLGDGDFGIGMIAGIGMAIIAMIADRITQNVSRNMQAKLGIQTSAT